MKALFKMDFDCGRMGNLEGVFIADTEDVEYLVNNKISGYNPFEYTLCTSETEDIPDNGVDWDDCTVQEYIDFMRKGIIPQYYEKDYKEWLSSQKED